MQSTRLLAGLGLVFCLGSAVLAGPVQAHSDSRLRDEDRGHAFGDYSRPPTNFGPLRESIHAKRHKIGRGSAVPAHMRIVKGKRLPAGWDGRLSAKQSRHLPQYRGYEWRRVGSSLVLVDSRSGIVHDVLRSVLD
ncbi:RcnB family protein [Azorhizophilus paspali]|uniref:RcnB family protein n=1 Tax=Azorhizophilus paspali TaxID=69963 RepID=A0ABV6SJ73_AZOPA